MYTVTHAENCVEVPVHPGEGIPACEPTASVYTPSHQDIACGPTAPVHTSSHQDIVYQDNAGMFCTLYMTSMM